MAYRVWLRTNRLTDGSHTYDVVVETPQHDLVFYAKDWAEAEAIADAVRPCESIGVYGRGE